MNTSMEVYVYPILVLFYSTILFLLSRSATIVDTISRNQAIKDGDTIVSNGEMFELGFFSPGKSKNRYLGIWYKKISTGTVVWVANREKPINDTSGIFEVSREGALRILSAGNTLIWSSNSTVSVRSRNLEAQLLDSGNLVLWDEHNTKENPIWQSFDYPGDTLLPGMKIGKDLVTGREKYLTSWKSPDDPSIGLYKNWIDTNGYPQIFQREGRVLHSRLGHWNGVGFHGFPIENPNPIYSVEFVINEKEIYYRYKQKSSVVPRIHVSSEGIALQLNWIERTQEWAVFGNIVVDSCGRYARCGPYGTCSINMYPPCSCLEGFEPRLPEEWNAADWSGGCQRKQPLQCGSEDGFWKVSGIKFPDTRYSRYNVSMTLEECEMTCTRDCSCTAYAQLDIRNGGSGCLLWFHELKDIREYDQKQELYIRMAASELADLMVSQSSFNKKKVLIVVLTTSLAALLVFAIAYACKKTKKRDRNWNAFDKKNTSVQMEDLDALPFFNLHEIAKATDNFSIDNKIGEGGFGPVYKGVLEDGRDVAVKRLSESSQQGLDEFKNEVICIAKLQHRNLVKLLGYCIHGNEMILIYEYMANKSLDSFLFDETRSLILDWPQRFRIIHGMARGILYLHQDSRLQIIHRDLKAGNILLDGDMNPKISDFGLARKFVGQDAMAKTKKVVGTYGYISPEYAVHGRFSIKSDVFSFGVLVLEIVSGKKNRGFSHGDHNDNLLGHASTLFFSADTIAVYQNITDGETIVSENQRFEMGFFTQAVQEIDTWGYGILSLVNGGGTVFWSSNSSTSGINVNPAAQLLGTGNLVIKDGNIVSKENFIWQSFDYPGDAFISGMKLGKNFITGKETYLTSWRRSDDPSPGEYTVRFLMVQGKYQQVYIRKSSMIETRIGPYEGIAFAGQPNFKPNPVFSFKLEMVVNPREMYFLYTSNSNEFQIRQIATPEGKLEIWNLNMHTQEWRQALTLPLDNCDKYGFCGPYGSCSTVAFPNCGCLKGFELKKPEESSPNNWTKGCQRSRALDCGPGEGFLKFSSLKLPYTQNAVFDDMSLQECEVACKNNCSCTAYANPNTTPGGVGCLLWLGDLIDVRVYPQNGQDLYVRLAASELLGLIVLGLILALYIQSKKRRSDVEREGKCVGSKLLVL
ncbi:hypothetical protein L6452_14241 [Arctium lappa]|uniref:Uncharacterized protein n=1 Tax=Arctium lappa TaxID=4217 RepID=A0ACB9CKS1_ARCLA|nr:hypothetical protein L6452_14241 [Arctium lappa]